MVYNKELAKDLVKFIKQPLEEFHKEFDNYESFYGNVLLCRIYRYEPENVNSGIIDKDGKPMVAEHKRRVIPIAVLIRKGINSQIEAEEGDLLALTDDLVGVSENPSYLDYLIETNL